MPRKPTNIDSFARILIEKDLPAWQRPCPGEMTYVSIGTKLIQQKLSKYFDNTGVKPPTYTAVKRWFYFGSPNWVIAVLHNIFEGAKND